MKIMSQHQNYTRAQAAEILCLSVRTIARKIAANEIATVKVGKRRRVIPVAEINRILGTPIDFSVNP